MSEPTTSAAQRATQRDTAVKVVEPQPLSERTKQVYDAVSRRAFELFLTEGSEHGRDLDHWLKAEAELLQPVPLTMTETDEALTVRADVPGFSATDLQIGVEQSRLTIGGRRQSKEEEKKGKAIRKEQRCNEILRVITLPVAVDPAKATATLTNGVIELVLPKVAKAKAATAD